MYADPDPDPAAQINADPCGCGCGSGSGSETLLESDLFLIFSFPSPELIRKHQSADLGLLDALRERWQVQTDVTTAANAAANVKNHHNATNIKHFRNGAYSNGTAAHIV